MKACITNILSLIIIIITAACNNNDTALADVEKVLIHHPDSALHILSQQESNTPYCIVLKTLAADLANTPLPGDSLVSRAASHYASGNDAKM